MTRPERLPDGKTDAEEMRGQQLVALLALGVGVWAAVVVVGTVLLWLVFP